MTSSESRGAKGHIIDGKYRLVRCIGRGGMGSIWQAEHTVLGAPVAVKLVDPKLLNRDDIDPQQVLKRFLREARAAAAIRSPHVVQILDYGVSGSIPFMVLELLEGESLDQRLERQAVLPYTMTSRIVTHIARALTRAHEAGLVHRDLKPSNVFLVRNDDEEMAKVLDFGLVKMSAAPFQGRSELTGMGVVGTPYYMSPEQAMGKAVDYRTDLWAVGVLVFECVCGRLPFISEVVTELLLEICVKPMVKPSQIRSVPTGFDDWFARATSRDPAGRFQSARDMADALRAVLAPEESSRVLAQRKEDPIPPPSSERQEHLDMAPTLPLAASIDKTTMLLRNPGAPAFYRDRRGLVVTVIALVAVTFLALLFLLSGQDEPPPRPTVPSTPGAH